MLLSGIALLAATASAAHGPHNRHRHLARQAAAAANTSASSTTAFLDSDAVPGGFVEKGDSGVSAQMMFLGTKDTVYVLDKAENNSMQIGGHPAWGAKYDLKSHEATAMAVSSNTFCAGGLSLANGSWAVFGGNQPVTHDGKAVNDKSANPSGANPYLNTDGGEAVRVITPCDDDTCKWVENSPDLTMTSKRWYPTVEGLADGSVIVIGGDFNGGYVAVKEQNNPTYEYWPKQPSGAIHMQFLEDTLPLCLFPLTWLLPSGKLFLQAAKKTILYDMNARQEIPLPDMPYASRVYPASAAAAMLPLTPANNYTAEIVFCGGSNADFANSTDGNPGFNVTAVPADDTCVRIRPDDASPAYEDDDHLPEGRSMGSLVYLPDGTMWLGNGVQMGTAGYSDKMFAIGQSLGQSPIYTPVVYNPNAALGKRFDRSGLGTSTQERMYHSTAILLADGSVLVSGSNPNADVTISQWPTKYSTEKWYPSWYNEPRPVASAWPKSLSYGGDAWSLTINDASIDPATIKVAVIRTGFSTHGMNFGQRYLELATSTVVDHSKNQTTVNVAQMPPNPNIFTPGPAMIFLVVKGVPSEGEMITIGNGQIGKQPVAGATVLPASQVIQKPAPSSSSSSSSSSTTASHKAPPSVSLTVETAIASAAETDAKKGHVNAVDGAMAANSTSKTKSGASSVSSPVLFMGLAVLGCLSWF